MRRLTSYQIKELQACGFSIDSEGESATRELTVRVYRFSDGSLHYEATFPGGHVLESLLVRVAELEQAGEVSQDDETVEQRARRLVDENGREFALDIASQTSDSADLMEAILHLNKSAAA